MNCPCRESIHEGACVDGQQKDETKPISTKTSPDGWRRVEFDLSEWSGQTVKLELLNEASDWYCEAGYWSEIKIDSEADGVQADERASRASSRRPVP